MKIWAKIIKGEHITQSTMYEIKGFFDLKKLLDYLTDICQGFDIPRPLVLNKHFRQFHNFNHTIFKPEDFVESVDFDHFTIEVAIDRNKKSSDFYSNL